VGLPAFGKFVDNGNGTGQFTFSPVADDRGNYTMTVSATDNGDGNGPGAVLSGTTSFVLTVNAANLPPHLLPIGDKVAVVGQPLQLTFKATDGDQDQLTFAAAGLPAAAVVSSGVLNWTPTASDVGKYPVLVTVTDNGNGDPNHPLKDQQTFTLTVRTSNQAPVWVSAGDQTAPEGQTLTAHFKAVDPDNDTVTYSATNLPVGAALDPITGTLTWTPFLAQVGTYSGIVLSATDGSLTATQTIAITVTPVNEPPHFIPLAPQSGREGTQLQFSLSAEDPNNDPLTYSVPAGATFDPKIAVSNGRPTSSRAAIMRCSSV
jgi:hypothetical protein